MIAPGNRCFYYAMKAGDLMIIHKVVADKKPKNCVSCPLIGRYPCGKQHKVQVSSGSAYVEHIPDNRCVIKEAGK